MSLPTQSYPFKYRSAGNQAGVVLFIAMIALVTLMLAAVALIRSVNTSAIITGNLAFKQAATMSGDGGQMAALSYLRTVQAANPIDTQDPFILTGHPFNNTSVAQGYYSTIGTINLMDPATWALSATAPVNDASGNSIRYIIERMCRPGTTLLSTSACMFSNVDSGPTNKGVIDATKAGGATPSLPPIYRITARITGPKNTLSYVQAFAY